MPLPLNPNPSPLGIVDANRLSVEEAVMPAPNFADVILGWLRPLSLTIVRKRLVDFQVREVEVEHATTGLIQPMGRERLAMKAEGERSWRWWNIIAAIGLELQTDDVVIHRGSRLRVMAKADWSENGYVIYDAVDDYDYKPNQT